MIGTNNLHSNSNEEIVTGIIDVINAISYKQPNAQLYVIQILPREGYEERISQLNRSLEEKLRTNENIKIDSTSIILEELESSDDITANYSLITLASLIGKKI